MITIPLLKQHYFLLVFTRVARNFRKKVVKSTIFELEKSFKYIFGVAENFWFNGGVKFHLTIIDFMYIFWQAVSLLASYNI